MERYDYLEAIKEDVLNYINGNDIAVTSGNRDEVEQELNDTLFTCDGVTGNASGSYTLDAWTAEEQPGTAGGVRVRHGPSGGRCGSVRRHDTLLPVGAGDFRSAGRNGDGGDGMEAEWKRNGNGMGTKEYLQL